MATQPLIIGHRGAAALAPENTLVAFSRAIADGAEGIEFDVRLSRDGIPVVIHDSSLKRTGGLTHLVSQLTAAELKEVDVGSWFGNGKAFRGEKIPTLTQVFQLFKGQPGSLYLEMKGEQADAQRLVETVVRIIVESQLAARVIVECFNLEALKLIKNQASAIRTAALFEARAADVFKNKRAERFIDEAASAAADEIALHHRLATPSIVEKIAMSGFPVVVWTVDSPSWMAKAKRLGCTAIITNNPAVMRAARDGINAV